jgi:hypothetical protein
MSLTRRVFMVLVCIMLLMGMCLGVDRWEERVAEEEAGVRIIRDYVIDILDEGEDGVIHRLELTRWEGGYAERYDIRFLGNKIVVGWYYRRGGPLFTRAILQYSDSFEEIPWFVVRGELREFIEKEGVKRAYYLILDYLKTLFTEPFRTE